MRNKARRFFFLKRRQWMNETNDGLHDRGHQIRSVWASRLDFRKLEVDRLMPGVVVMKRATRTLRVRFTTVAVKESVNDGHETQSPEEAPKPLRF